MTNELEKILIPLIEKAASGAENAADFAIAQAPEVVEQLLRWKMCHSLLVFVGLIGLFALMTYGVYKYVISADGPSYDGTAEVMIIVLYPMVSLFLLCAGSVAHALDWLQILIAPKLYLIEYVARLAKGG
jgi:hypothetical protein